MIGLTKIISYIVVIIFFASYNVSEVLAKNAHEIHIDCMGIIGGQTVVDCAGICGGHNVIDLCGICGGKNKSCTDCNGIVMGTAKYDQCNVCEGNNLCLDCKGIPYGGASLDLCGICDGDSTTCMGCDNRPNSGKVIDKCNVCGGKNECLDCFDIPFGTALRDRCGVCNGQDLCVGCDNIPNSGKVVDACSICGGDNSTCAGCDRVPNSGKFPDSCGVCGGDNTTCCSPQIIKTDIKGAPKRSSIKPVICGKHGSCDSTVRGCSCDLGWTGPYCTKSQDVCGSTSCSMHGSCNPLTGKCMCNNDWVGYECQYPSCTLNGIYSPIYRKCLCLDGFAGEDCETCDIPQDESQIYICILRSNTIDLSHWSYYLKLIDKKEYELRMEIISIAKDNNIDPLINSILPNTTTKDNVYYDCSCRPHKTIPSKGSGNTLKFDIRDDGTSTYGNEVYMSSLMTSSLLTTRGVHKDITIFLRETVNQRDEINVILAITNIMYPVTYSFIGIFVLFFYFIIRRTRD